MPRYCFAICALPAHWDIDYVIQKIGPEHVAHRFSAGGDACEKSILVSIPPLDVSGIKNIDQDECLIVRSVDPGQLDKDDGAARLMLRDIGYAYMCLEVMYWPQGREKLRSFLRVLAAAEPKMRISFASAVISAANFLRVDALVPPPGKWDSYHRRDIYDEEFYFGNFFPIPAELAEEIRYLPSRYGSELRIFI